MADLLHNLARLPPRPLHDDLDAATAALAQLRAHTRATNLAVRAAKQNSVEVRAAMDATHLMLQNLLYERRHLEREIEKCNQFA
jgi:THO complex subunit 5